MAIRKQAEGTFALASLFSAESSVLLYSQWMVPQKSTGLKNDNCLFSPQAFKAVIYIPSALFAQMLALQIPCVKLYVHYLTSRADRNSNTTSFFFPLPHITLTKYITAPTALHITGVSLSACFLIGLMTVSLKQMNRSTLHFDFKTVHSKFQTAA